MEYRAGQPQEEVGIDGCGLCSLARTFARCARTSGYEFNHRAGPGLTQMPRCETGQRRRPQGETSGSEHRPAAACAPHRARPSAAVKVAGRGRR